MKSFWGLLVALLLSPTLSQDQRPAQPVENAHPTYSRSIQHQTQQPEETTLYFPDYVDGGGWSVQLALSNFDAASAAEVDVEVYDQGGRLLVDFFDSETTFEIPALGSRVLKSEGVGAIRRGWVQVQGNTASVRGLLTYRDAQTGFEVGVEPVPLRDRFALFVEESGDIGTGLAIFKPDVAPSIELRIRDQEGNDPLEGVFVPWGDFNQAARTLPEWFDLEGVDTGFLTDFRGLLLLRSEDESLFAPLGLRFGKRSPLFSAVPAIRNQRQQRVGTTLYFPDYVDGDGWSVQLALSNVDATSAAEVDVEVHDQDGLPLVDFFDSETTFEIPSLGSRVLKSEGVGAIRRGWIRVRSETDSVRGLLIYREAPTGVEVSVEPVQLGDQFALFVEETSEVGAGVAIFKPGPLARVEFQIRDEKGNDPLEGVLPPWGDFNQAARTLPEWFDMEGIDRGFLTDFRGLLVLRTEDRSLFSPLGLRFGKGSGSLSAVPAVRLPVAVRIGDEDPPSLVPTVTMSASPSSIDWGQSATLTWSSTNAVSATITPGIGAVPVSGSRKVSPTVTTTYRITVWGADGEMQTATASTEVTVVISERAVLRALYEATGGPNWTHNDNWLTDRPLGEWDGVGVDGGGRVIRLWLSSNNLRGSIPAELASLTNLEELLLFANDLSGKIPAELGSLTNLRSLNLSGNHLTGSIPAELGSLTNLRSLNLSVNDLGGAIPAELGSLTKLTRLSLPDNWLTGSIPAELGSLTKLRSLGLGGNNLTGSIPAELGSLTNLEYLSLFNNNLTGTIPADLGSLTNLEQLSLSRNDLTGSIPAQLSLLTNLKRLTLTSNNLTGSIPAELGSLTNLEYLSLFNNNLTGTIPAELGSLTNLVDLHLTNNNLTGSIPAELGLLTNLHSLWLRHNFLTGPVPSSFLGMSLRTFLFSSNDGLCVPGGTNFVNWSKGIEGFEGAFCNDSDRALLEVLYDIAGGPAWTNSTGWRGDDALGEWYGVSVDSLGRLTTLDLSHNGLEGHLPRQLGRLSRMAELRINGNSLSGRLPLSLASLSSLRELHYADTELCAPVEARFQEWLNGLTFYDGTGVHCAPLSDRDVLMALYEATGGPNWTDSENWLTDRPLGEWSQVDVDDDGRVIGLAFFDNNLRGPIPAELGSLTNLKSLRLAGNNLRGPIPAELGWLTDLEEIALYDNNLMGSIPVELGSLTNLKRLFLSTNNLTGSIPAELGSLANLERLWLSGNDLTGPIPVELGSLSNLWSLILSGNNLTGPIPPELGSLVNLEVLWLARNFLTGSIPAELGSLTNLRSLILDGNNLTGAIPAAELSSLTNLEDLWLHWNDLTGSIPPELASLTNLKGLLLGKNNLTGSIPGELGSLPNLESLKLYDNDLTGPIPEELGSLTNLRYLSLSRNDLTGPIPPELGSLTNLGGLILSNNDLTGPIPGELGGLENLRQMTLSGNVRMSGALPASLTNLHRLEALFAVDTGLCVPSQPRFLDWLEGVWKRRVAMCGAGDPSAAYLTQAVQSREFPVPLVAGEQALLRVFVTAPRATDESLPPVRATFYLEGEETYVADIPGQTSPHTE